MYKSVYRAGGSKGVLQRQKSMRNIVKSAGDYSFRYIFSCLLFLWPTISYSLCVCALHNSMMVTGPAKLLESLGLPIIWMPSQFLFLMVVTQVTSNKSSILPNILLSPAFILNLAWEKSCYLIMITKKCNTHNFPQNNLFMGSL